MHLTASLLTPSYALRRLGVPDFKWLLALCSIEASTSLTTGLHPSQEFQQSGIPQGCALSLTNSLYDEAKPMCSLSFLCLSAAERGRLDVVQDLCPSRILRIPPEFVSRVFNLSAEPATMPPPTCFCIASLSWLGRFCVAHLTMRCGNHHLFLHHCNPSPGRPKREWVTEVGISKAFQYVGDDWLVTRLVQSPLAGRRTVDQALSVHAPPGV